MHSTGGEKVLKDIEQLTQKVESISEELTSLQKLVLGAIPPKELPTREVSLLICRIGTEQVTFLLNDIERVIYSVKLTPYPESPKWIPGYLNFHGATVPVIDLNTRVTGEVREILVSDYIILCKYYHQLHGLVVQEVIESVVVETLDLDKNIRQIKHASYLFGIINNLESPIPLFSIEKLISSSHVPEIADNDR